MKILGLWGSTGRILGFPTRIWGSAMKMIFSQIQKSPLFSRLLLNYRQIANEFKLKKLNASFPGSFKMLWLIV